MINQNNQRNQEGDNQGSDGNENESSLGEESSFAQDILSENDNSAELIEEVHNHSSRELHDIGIDLEDKKEPQVDTNGLENSKENLQFAEENFEDLRFESVSEGAGIVEGSPNDFNLKQDQFQSSVENIIENPENSLSESLNDSASSNPQNDSIVSDSGNTGINNAPNNKKKNQLQAHVDEVSVISDPEEQIRKVLEIAEQEGPFHAIELAKKMENLQGSNYLLDEVQDGLSLMKDEFRKKGFLKEVN